VVGGGAKKFEVRVGSLLVGWLVVEVGVGGMHTKVV